jgi:hypothetical protein
MTTRRASPRSPGTVRVDGLITDALTLPAACEPSASPETHEAHGLLALVARQGVEQRDDGTWRIAERVAPDQVISTVDPDARHMYKSQAESHDGYKAHIAVEPELAL